MTRRLSRRGFLAGAGIVGLGVAGATVGRVGIAEAVEVAPTALPAVQPAAAVMVVEDASASTPASPSTDSTIGAHDTTYGAILNPQEDFSAATTDYSALFSPLQIAHITLKNRMMKSCAGSEMQKSPDWPSDTNLAYYEAFCKGGIGMICYEPSSIIPGSGIPTVADVASGAVGGEAEAPPADASGAPEVTATPGGLEAGVIPLGAQMDLSTDAGIPGHKVIADAMHALDTPIIAQMLDMFMATGGGSSLVQASKLENAMNTPPPHADHRGSTHAAASLY
ncbi:MAG: twin-arginine translocation signal domain-containing protein [Coriobacteriales bacterium]|jgi:hypothetical protein|nr:twin-arginine translocation signal domain-containing protein [Coriobacteriales bacterium]